MHVCFARLGQVLRHIDITPHILPTGSICASYTRPGHLSLKNQHPPPPDPNHSYPPLVVLLLVGMGIRSAVLSLEADGLVDDQMAGARVDGSADGESNDDTCGIRKYGSQVYGTGHIAAAHRGETARGGSASGGGDAAKRCALWFAGFVSAFTSSTVQ